MPSKMRPIWGIALRAQTLSVDDCIYEDCLAKDGFQIRLFVTSRKRNGVRIHTAVNMHSIDWRVLYGWSMADASTESIGFVWPSDRFPVHLLSPPPPRSKLRSSYLQRSYAFSCRRDVMAFLAHCVQDDLYSSINCARNAGRRYMEVSKISVEGDCTGSHAKTRFWIVPAGSIGDSVQGRAQQRSAPG
ncbi:uncharacterized protein LAESUDRAFT_453798 [Laetiporus sulphureus 93-53]|uniref:Uncharacterized protein n=1 Tax=Laetiporus sulphureus 93-53 TaxID=1314785 RepID=A0A165BV07_9APHY|nr:uncharacterized protein LAESUDRAFT_453798 [Laetiporus sulphureus 93-53]KZT01705.1 hypothetical protein LAESUDRAFT_453798 [Laetiporus sulphureus 93-53]